MFCFSTLNRPKSCHVLRNVSDDEIEDENDAISKRGHTYLSSDLKEPYSNVNQNSSIQNHTMNNESIIPKLQNSFSHSTTQDGLDDVSKVFNHVNDKKEEVDPRIAIRENTFVTNENSFTANMSASNPVDYDKYPILDTNTQIALINFPPTTFDLQLSRFKRLNFDQIKTDLTASRRGVFIIQALRWVSGFYGNQFFFNCLKVM